MSILYGKGGLKSGSPVYGEGGLDSGSIIYGGLGDKHATRNILTFDGSPYGTLDTPITFASDFEVDIEFASTDTVVAGKGLFGYSISGSTNFLQSNNPSAQVNFTTVDGVVTWTHGNTHLDGRVHKLTAYRLGNILGIKIDGTIANTNDVGAASTVDIDLLGCLGITTTPSQFFNGQLLSAKFTDKSGSPDVVTNYVFDSGSTIEQYARGSSTLKVTLTNFTAANWNRYTLQRNITHDAGTIVEAWVGDNIIINGTFDTDSDWVLGAEWSISGGKLNRAVAAATSTSQASIIHQSSPLLLKYSIDKIGGDNSSIFLGGALFNNTPDSGDFIILNTVGTSPNIALLTDVNFEGSFDNISGQHLLEVA